MPGSNPQNLKRAKALARRQAASPARIQLRALAKALKQDDPEAAAFEVRRLQDCAQAWRLVVEALDEYRIPCQVCESGVQWAVRMIHLLAREAGLKRRTR